MMTSYHLHVVIPTAGGVRCSGLRQAYFGAKEEWHADQGITRDAF